MLWTTPESLHETLPLTVPAKDLAITADARIDNRDELLKAFHISSHIGQGMSGSELILLAYEKWGECCPEHLLGDYVFAIWDGQKQTFFCARDPFGVKPFYYHFRAGRIFLFASEIKPLFCFSEIPRRLNEVQLAYYLSATHEDKEITFYHDILRLPAGYCMEVSPRKKKLQPHWSLDPLREVHLSSDQEYALAFRELFTEAVHCRLRSAFPIGSALSGGLDSSSICCVAQQLLRGQNKTPVQTFSQVYEARPECDETPYINAVLASRNFESHLVPAPLAGPLFYLDHLTWCEDEPVSIGNLFLSWNLYGVVQREGIRVFLEGHDGDTTVSHGEGYFSELAHGGHWIKFFSEATKHIKRWEYDYTTLDLVRKYAFTPFTSKIPKHVRESLGLGRENVESDEIIKPKFAKRIALRERTRLFKWEWSQLPATERTYHYFDLSSGLISSINEVISKTSEAFNLSVVFPFFDRRLAEFCLALPPWQKRCQGWNRIVLRRAMKDILTDKVRWRATKADFSHNFHDALLTYERPLLDKVVLNRPEAIEDYVDIPALQGVYKKFLSRKALNDGAKLWRALTLALWLDDKDF